MTLTEAVPDDLAGLDVTLVGYVQKLTGRPKLIDSGLEVVSVQ